jgi:hypothetical protein
MPDPATAHAQLEQQIQHAHEHERAEPMELLEDGREMVPVGKRPNN